MRSLSFPLLSLGSRNPSCRKFSYGMGDHETRVTIMPFMSRHSSAVKKHFGKAYLRELDNEINKLIKRIRKIVEEDEELKGLEYRVGVSDEYEHIGERELKNKVLVDILLKKGFFGKKYHHLIFCEVALEDGKISLHYSINPGNDDYKAKGERIMQSLEHHYNHMELQRGRHKSFFKKRKVKHSA